MPASPARRGARVATPRATPARSQGPASTPPRPAQPPPTPPFPTARPGPTRPTARKTNARLAPPASQRLTHRRAARPPTTALSAISATPARSWRQTETTPRRQAAWPAQAAPLRRRSEPRPAPRAQRPSAAQAASLAAAPPWPTRIAICARPDFTRSTDLLLMHVRAFAPAPPARRQPRTARRASACPASTQHQRRACCSQPAPPARPAAARTS